ncbi:Swi3-domain-containing protein [Coniochaeta ligniaria NRRL 30616]|uniref:Chromosome segregation in meiosis protein n=1 Tax=Coniochaeta ligniaria NRRL 30616 TaxID=1408157 RepID=A0A1J7IUA2_9PEZI|nr:Swi3-domain-containing protein [Coniochaeta ligniaria NRRL 30616]
MPSKTASKPPARESATADFDDYLLDGDLSDNPFRSPSPTSNNKRKEPSGLGIDEEVEVKKRVTVPRVKLDEARLLSENGIPKLRKRAKHLHLKGKGHEWSDASKLLSFYQIWLDDLFPKAKFLDALGMVEKAGHKTAMHKARMDWIDEGKPKDKTFDDDGEDTYTAPAPEAAREPTRIAPVFERAKTTAAGSQRQRTPEREDLFGDEDIYDATPRAKASRAGGGEPDEDDLDALMAEAESAPVRSIFGGGGKPAGSLFGGPVTAAVDEPDEEDLDALLAEQEATGPPASRPTTTAVVNSIFGDGKPKAPAVEEADNDLDALMAEMEGDGAASKPPPATADAAKLPDADSGPKDSFADDEEAMAEMDGLW